MESIEKLREAVRKGKAMKYSSASEYYRAIDEAVESIEAEIAEHYIELPPPPKPGQDAIDYIRGELDRRGVNWKEWSRGKVETKFFAPGTDGTGSFCVSVSVSKNHRKGPVFYKGYLLDPRYALMAALDQPYTAPRPRTLEEVLWDALDEYDKGELSTREVAIAYADEIRELLGVEE